MEHLKSLESSLPPEQAPTDCAIEDLSGELSQEFKSAANAVTRLYRVARERDSLTKHQGYIECLDDVLMFLKKNPNAQGDAVQQWCLKLKKLRLLDDSDEAHTSSFNFGGPEMRPTKSFRASIPPLSVERSFGSQNNDNRNERHMIKSRLSAYPSKDEALKDPVSGKDYKDHHTTDAESLGKFFKLKQTPALKRHKLSNHPK